MVFFLLKMFLQPVFSLLHRVYPEIVRLLNNATNYYKYGLKGSGSGLPDRIQMFSKQWDSSKSYKDLYWFWIFKMLQTQNYSFLSNNLNLSRDRVPLMIR